MRKGENRLRTMSALTEIRCLLNRSSAVLVIAHVSPDGDTLGSALGLAWALRSAGVRVTLSCADRVPAVYRFLPGSEAFGAHALTDEDLVVAVDVSSEERLGSVYDRERDSRVGLVVIDHHVTNPAYGTVNYIRDASSTAELVLELLEHMGLPIDATVATCLLAGLVTDTQGFRTSSTTAESLRAAVRLVESGADLQLVMSSAFRQRTVPSLALWGTALQQVQYDDGVIWCVVTEELLRRSGGNGEMVNGLVNFLSSVNEAQVAIVFRQIDRDRVEVGFRAVPGVDVSQVAVRLGGGGHPQASGTTLTGDLEGIVRLTLGEVRRELRETRVGAGA